ncbi:hypothetical protein B296_00032395 [Ensete ventricosum]|uniref:Uncharacterized protein n=1 Tax=Ensete ventricosum TaxID=4639 RepID=A0A427ADP7_ENSVE|nr:hypothetical protein B296_00032395 [Ensete ventricosum]
MRTITPLVNIAGERKQRKECGLTFLAVTRCNASMTNFSHDSRSAMDVKLRGSGPSTSGEMAEASGGGEHDESDVDVAQDGQLVGLLDEAISTLGEGHLAIGVVLYPLYLELNSTHDPR